MIADDRFAQKRAGALKHLRMSHIDPPIRDIVKSFKGIRACFTLQCCHGHIIHQKPGSGKSAFKDPASRPPVSGLYQLAYVALVLENSLPGRELYRGLADISGPDEDFIQFGSADWFWETKEFCNSYVIQVCPRRFRHLDRFKMDAGEARRWLAARAFLFKALRKMVGLVP